MKHHKLAVLFIAFTILLSATARDAVSEEPAHEETCLVASRIQAFQESQNSKTPAQIRFINETDETVSVFWMDFNGDTVKYASLAPGQQYLQRTYLTHPWQVVAPSRCIAFFLPRPGTTAARINY